MAKQVIWTKNAQRERKEILKYWIEQNKSKTYSIKFNNLFKESINLLKIRPEIGKKTDIENVRIKIVRDYLIFYELTPDFINILSTWDSRQDPNKLKI
jgi:addiction module RelE/StbE family toxin